MKKYLLLPLLFSIFPNIFGMVEPIQFRDGLHEVSNNLLTAFPQLRRSSSNITVTQFVHWLQPILEMYHSNPSNTPEIPFYMYTKLSPSRNDFLSTRYLILKDYLNVIIRPLIETLKKDNWAPLLIKIFDDLYTLMWNDATLTGMALQLQILQAFKHQLLEQL